MVQFVKAVAIILVGYTNFFLQSFFEISCILLGVVVKVWPAYKGMFHILHMVGNSEDVY